MPINHLDPHTGYRLPLSALTRAGTTVTGICDPPQKARLRGSANLEAPLDYTLSGSVFITFDFVGFHRWLEAPDEVDYLRARHRHLFKVRIDVSVEHADRAIEYHMLKRDVIKRMFPMTSSNGEYEFGALSCETIAGILLQNLQTYYPDRPYYRVEVSEDGENGSVVEARS